MRLETTGAPTTGKTSFLRALSGHGHKKVPVKTEHLEQIPPKWSSFGEGVKAIYDGTNYKTLPIKTLNALAYAYEARKTKGWKVFDEALILCGFSLAIRMPDHAEWYFRHVPLPDILVYLVAEKDDLMARNALRGDRSRPDKTLRCIRAHKKYMRILRARKCNIMQFNTSKISAKDIASNVLLEMSKLDKLRKEVKKEAKKNA